MNIDSASQIAPRADNSARNLYIKYKTFPDNEPISTPILWQASESAKISHKMIFPATTQDAEKLISGYLILEVWDKMSASQDELLGLVKLQLRILGEALHAQNFAQSVYPCTAYDEYRPIHNLRYGKDVGYLKICLALGTTS
jgi:hypothetical protein